MESLTIKSEKSLPIPTSTIGISIPSGISGTSTGHAPSIPEATPSLSTSTSFMVQRGAFPALANLYKVIKATKSSSTSTSSANILMLPGPSNDAIMVAKEKLLSFLAYDVEDVVSFHQSLANTIMTLKKHPEFSESIQAALTKLQHQLQFIVAHVSSSTSTSFEYEKEARLKDKAFEDFQLLLESYPEIKEWAEKLMAKKKELNEELAKIQRELEQVEREKFELDQTANALVNAFEPLRKEWEKQVDKFPKFEDAKAKALVTLGEVRKFWMELRGALASV